MSTPQIRNLRFDTYGEGAGVGVGVPRYWHGGRRSVTAFFDNLSIFFPVGERFFVRSVRAFERRVTDEELRASVNAFCGQEGIHGREHVRYNEMLAAQGYPADAMEARVTRLLGVVKRVTSRRMQLAATCALEHFTALMGEMILADPTILEGADPTMAALWRWHAAEENEHKAVAYDVFLAAGGTYAERVIAMAFASVIFWAKVAEHQVRMMSVDGTLWSASEWRALARFLFVEPGGLGGLLPRYVAYYRPGFHPNDVDSDAVVEAWKLATPAPPHHYEPEQQSA
jgi:predicted metal-dependent hydrolase